ncbi:UNVERIFIED_CONTAM: hypothetical protein GTU68_027657 [Idotea baltica]|nr:hypothetical protein [Idotea baltica]
MFSLVGETNINFLSGRIPCAIVSLALIATGLFAFAQRGEKNYDIDFTGGTMVTFQLTEPSDTATVEGVLASIFKGASKSDKDGDDQQVLKFDAVTVRATSEVDADDFSAALAAMQEKLATSPLFDEVNTFQSAVASEMKRSAILAIIISLIAIVAYVWFRFQRITFGLAAVVALVHDVLIVLGVMALASMRINLPMVAAFLTIVGYSLNDTIVVFDRIREVRGKNPDLTDAIVNTSLNQTLSRTLLTSLTTFLVVAILYAIGGEGIHGFAFCLTMGVIVGTYSSIYVASPVLIWLMNREN